MIDRTGFARALVTVLLISTLYATSSATDKRFWYGMYNVGPYPEYFNELSGRYRMNWVTTGVNDAGVVQALADTGMQAVSIAYRYISYPDTLDPTFNKVGVYSEEYWLRMEADGDTIAYNWNPDDETMFIRTVEGTVIFDDDAVGDSAWFFEYGEDDSGYVMIWHHRDFTSDNEWPIDLRCRIKAEASASSEPLAYLRLRSTIDGSILASRTILRSGFQTSGYREFFLRISDDTTLAPWHTDVILEWAETADMAVDWVGYDSPDGYELGNEQVDDEIKTFVQTYGFSGDSAVLGFYLAEEIWSDGNVYPQKRIDSLIESVYPNQHAFTEHHYLGWWDSRNQFGQRNAISGRFQEEEHVTTTNYPMSGYNPNAKVLTDSGIVTMAQMACVANPPLDCSELGSDTSICFQVMMDSAGQWFRLHRRFCDSLSQQLSINSEFVPFLQSYSKTVRSIPTGCNDDTTWYVDHREPTESETKCQAGMALANGAGGLLYFRHATSVESKKIKLDCQQDSVVFEYERYQGLLTLTGVQDALEEFIGPFVDSLGHYFVDFEWLGGGRLDASRDSAGLSGLFDSTTKSLTFTGTGDEAFIEAGVFEDSLGADYFMLVNRRAYDAQAQSVRSWLNLPAGQYYVVNMYNYDSVLTGSLPGGEIQFTTTLPPGESKLFKIIPAGSSPVAGAAVPEQVEGNVSITGTVTIDSNRSLTIYGPSEIRMTAGSGYHFEAHGPMTVIGTASSPVVFRSSNTSNPGTQDWSGIYHYGPGDLSFKHVSIQDAYRGVWVLNTSSADSLSIDSCEFKHGFYAGIQNDRDTATATVVSVTDSRFSGLTHGIYVYRGRTEVDGCVFRSSMAKAITIEAGNARPTGGQIKNCDFDSLTGDGIYLSMIKNHSTPESPILEWNHFGPHWVMTDGNSQKAINIVNCNGAIHLDSNRIDGVCFGYGQGVQYVPHYGISNYSTATYIQGSYYQSPSLDGAHYALFSLSSGTSDTDFAQVRATKFDSCKYGAYVYNNSTVDLDGSELPNAFESFCSYHGRYSVYNLDSNSTIPANSNYWMNTSGGNCEWGFPYTWGPVSTSGMLGYDPFDVGGPPKRATAMYLAESEPVPTSSSLKGNYPNPLNASTVIQFSLADAGHAEIEIFNILGQKVRQLRRGDLETGDHRLTWDGRDDRGLPVSSGVYFYRLTSSYQQTTRKMVVVK